MKDRIGGLATLLALTSLAIPRGATSKAKTGAASEERAGATSGGTARARGEAMAGATGGTAGGMMTSSPLAASINARRKPYCVADRSSVSN